MRLFLTIVLAVVVLLAIAVGFAYWYDQTGQRPDPNFDASVASPTYTTADAPQITFDIAHRNFHTPTNRYRPLADLLKRDGYMIAEQTLPFAAQSLEHVKILVIANVLGPDGHEGRPAFEPSEELALADWVRGGGALLLVADHVPFGDAAKRLAGQFGVTMQLAYARDDVNHAGWDNEVLLFSRANGLLMPGPIVDGRSPAERIEKVVTFTGQSLSVPPGATVILRKNGDVVIPAEAKLRTANPAITLSHPATAAWPML